MTKTHSTEVAIKVSGLYKEFVLPQSKTTSLKQAAINIVRDNKKTTQKVLNDINFTVNKGDFFGIVGRNGSGKSTLLKLLAGIYTPDKGSIEINGSLVPFIELGVGFNAELSGRDNVYLNGALLGYSHKEMDAMYEEIVEFAEIGPFMDQKLKNYSSGMQVRLAFSIAIRAKADILVLDEVLAVGDEAFQRKCNDYFDKIKKDKNQTVILVTHSMEAVRKYCNKALLIDSGVVKAYGSPIDISNQYSLDNMTNKDHTDSDSWKRQSDHVKDVRLKMLSKNILSEQDCLEIRVDYETDIVNTRIAIDVFDVDRNIPIYSIVSEAIGGTGHISKLYRLELTEINNSNFKVAFAIRDESSNMLAYLPNDKLPSFILRRKDYTKENPKTSYAIIFNRGEWSDAK